METAALPGGFTAILQADEDIQDIANQVREDLQDAMKRNEDFSMYDAVLFRTQVVNGINYLIMINIGEEKNYVHVLVYRGPAGQHNAPKLTGFKSGHAATDPLLPFLNQKKKTSCK